MSKHVTFQPAGTSTSAIQPEPRPDIATAPAQLPSARPTTESPHHHRPANVESSRMNFLGKVLKDVKRTSGAVVSRLETSAQERMSIARHNVQSMKKKYFPEKPFSKAQIPSDSNAGSAQVREGEVDTTAPSADTRTRHLSFNPVRGVVSRNPKLSAETPGQSEHADRGRNKRQKFLAVFSPSSSKAKRPAISVAIESTSHVAVSTSLKRVGPEHLVAMLEGNLNGIRAGWETFSKIPYEMEGFENKRDLLHANVDQLRRMATGLSGMASIAAQIKMINIDTAGLSLENINRIAARANEIYNTPIQENRDTQLRPILFGDLGSPAIYGDSGQAQGSTNRQPDLALSAEVWLKIIKGVSLANSLLRGLEGEIAALRHNLEPSVTTGPENAAEASIASHVRSNKGKGKVELPVIAVSETAPESTELTIEQSVLAAGERAKHDFSVPLPETTAGLFQYK